MSHLNMWIERPGKIFLTAVEGDHVHLGLPLILPFSFTWYSCCIARKQILEMPYISKYSLNAPQHSSPPGRKAILSWEPCKIKADFCLEKSNQRNQYLILTPALFSITLHWRTISTERNLYSSFCQPGFEKNVPFQSSYFSPCLPCL